MIVIAMNSFQLNFYSTGLTGINHNEISQQIFTETREMSSR